MNKKLLLCVLLATVSLVVSAQEQEGEKKSFKLTGKPIVTIFGNYSTGLGSANDVSGFALERCYLGYQFSVLDNLGGKVIFDIGSTKVSGSDLERVAYVKNAMLTWTPGKFTFNFGLIGLEQFDVQEKFWGYRYIWKSFQDEYKFNSSADLGIVAKYQFTEWLGADVTLINGEGYKKLNKDNRYRYGFGITLKPLKPLTLRAYYDRYDGKGDNLKAQQTMALFAGYKQKWFSIGLEFDKLWNAEFVNQHNQTGYSVYATVYASKKISVFGRYDDLSSKEHYFKGDQRRAVVGVQYEPFRYLRISPNFQTVNPSVGKSMSYLFVNAEFKL